MPSIVSNVLRKQIRLLKPLITTFSFSAFRGAQEALGELGAKILEEKVVFHELMIHDIPAAWAVPAAECCADDDRILLYLHGGGYVAGSLKYAKGFAGVLASKMQARVLCVAYRLAPEHPFPAALDDALAAYQYLLEQGHAAEKISLIGESAGGGLLIALCLRLKEERLPMPGKAIPLSPWTDLTMRGGSYETNRKADPSLTQNELSRFAEAYATGQVENPLVSPVFGDLRGLPPCIIYVGGDEILLDDSRMLADQLTQAGVPCKLHVEPGMWHAYVLYGIPEANKALEEIRLFLES